MKCFLSTFTSSSTSTSFFKTRDREE